MSLKKYVYAVKGKKITLTGVSEKTAHAFATKVLKGRQTTWGSATTMRGHFKKKKKRR